MEAAKDILKNRKVRLTKSKADKLPFKNNSFDLVICQDTFHHFTNPIKVLKEIYRVTNNKGIIYLTDLRRDVAKEIIDIEIEKISSSSLTFCRYYIASIKAVYTVPEVRNILKQAGIRKFLISNGKTATI